jgi:hypothetical protein
MDLMNMLMNFLVPVKVRNFLSHSVNINYSRTAPRGINRPVNMITTISV